MTATYAPAETRSEGDWTQRTYRFSNGCGASVISQPGPPSSGTPLFELAVLDADGEIDYSTPITGNVLGWLDEAEVPEVLARIAALPAISEAVAS